MDGWMDGWMNKWMDGWTDGWTDGRTDGCIGQRIEKSDRMENKGREEIKK